MTPPKPAGHPTCTVVPEAVRVIVPDPVEELRGRLTCTIPQAGRAAGLGRDAAYAAAERGEIPTLRFGRRLVVPVHPFLRMLGVDPVTPDGGDAA